MELDAPPDDLLVPRVRLHDVDADDEGLLHRVGDDGALALLATPTLVLGALEPNDRLPLGRGHALRPRPLRALRAREALLLRLRPRLRSRRWLLGGRPGLGFGLCGRLGRRGG